MNYVIEYTETEDLAMQYAAANTQDWLNNAAHQRARVAIDEIVSIAIPKYFETNISVPASKEQIVADAFTYKWVTKANEREPI